MEILQRTKETLVLEDKSSILRIFFAALIMTGLLLPLVTMREFGIQSYYRFTYWIGGLLLLGGVLGFRFLYHQSRMSLNLDEKRISLEHMQGWKLLERKQIYFHQVEELRVAERTHKGRQQYRLELKHKNQGWLPVHKRFRKDGLGIKNSAKVLQAYIEAGA
ncbi:MAG: hypothetical protein AAF927_07885 [Bacteroidota bacterium]